ncbi:2-aminoethylphosphonate--pyruvate transaminase [Peptococcus simiae]|uniref:2-aminoethylphosphonate--pyruvate transaminase n=1 Tax=Peptococcus simiae TaxID=1643805 RepID=UPI0039816C8C
MEKKYKLLTPGPLTVSDTVRAAMDFDYCTWDDDYKQVTQWIRKTLLDIAQVSDAVYDTVLLQGSGSYAVEASLSSFLDPAADKLLVISNGKYGERIVEMARCQGLNHEVYALDYDQVPAADRVTEILDGDPAISHVFMVHNETTSGILNPLEEIGQVVQSRGKVFMLDAMSSFGAVPIDMEPISVLVTSANKCLQGVPGFAIILAKKDLLEGGQGKSRSVVLDLCAQYAEMKKEGKWRFTSPTHTVMAFRQALEEYLAEGGLEARHQRYANNQKVLSAGMEKLGFKPYVSADKQGPIITSFLYPTEGRFNFNDMYAFMKDNGYVIYPGKLTDVETFRIGNIGELYQEDMEQVVALFKTYMEERYDA